MTDKSLSTSHSSPPGPEPALSQLLAGNRIDDLLDEWMPAARKLMPAGTPPAQLPAYTYALLEALAVAATLSDRQRSAFLSAYQVWASGQRDKLQALIERLPSDSPEGRRLKWLLSPKAQDRRRGVCLATVLEMPGEAQSSGPALPAFAAFGLQRWAEGFNYAQFMETLRTHQQRRAPEIEAETEAVAPTSAPAAAALPPNLVHHFYRWILERDARWRRGDFAAVLDSRGATLHVKGLAVQHYDDPLQAVAEVNRRAQATGQTQYSDEADVVDWLASLKMPEPEQVTWEPQTPAAQDEISQVATLQYRGARYVLLRNRLAHTLSLCRREGEQTGATLATSEASLEANWWIRKDKMGRRAIVAWMLKEAKL